MKHPPQEHDIVPGRGIAVVGMGVILSIVIGTWVAYAIGACSTRDMGAGATERAAPRTSAEVNHIERDLFSIEAQGLESHRKAEDFLSRYGWVDKDQQIIHVPIAVATELYLGARR